MTVNTVTASGKRKWSVTRADIHTIITEELAGYGVTVTDEAALRLRLKDIEDYYCNTEAQ